MSSPESGFVTPIRRALDWWHGARALWPRAEHLERLTEEQIARMAFDIGVTSEELLRIVGSPAGSAALLHKRLASLGLDAEEITRLSPLLLADLERTCACCDSRERCAADMAESPDAPGWESYCPNSGTLRTLT